MPHCKKPKRLGRVLIKAQIARCLSLSLSKKAQVCPKKQQLTPGPSRGAIFDCDKPDFILKNGPWKGRKLYDLYKATEPPREWFPKLLLHARKMGITIFSSVFEGGGLANPRVGSSHCIGDGRQICGPTARAIPAIKDR